MKLYSLQINLQGQDENGAYNETKTYGRLGQGDVEAMKETSRLLAPVGDTVTYKVTEQR